MAEVLLQVHPAGHEAHKDHQEANVHDRVSQGRRVAPAVAGHGPGHDVQQHAEAAHQEALPDAADRVEESHGAEDHDGGHDYGLALVEKDGARHQGDALHHEHGYGQVLRTPDSQRMGAAQADQVDDRDHVVAQIAYQHHCAEGLAILHDESQVIQGRHEGEHKEHYGRELLRQGEPPRHDVREVDRPIPGQLLHPRLKVLA
mmetsp:Transcript_46013/g.133326  ORF Transcript_46013/g.133326 Transcript_46013/m.133326 type:complete len:202 (-) Transcript_46013:462-1067(-)